MSLYSSLSHDFSLFKTCRCLVSRRNWLVCNTKECTLQSQAFAVLIGKRERGKEGGCRMGTRGGVAIQVLGEPTSLPPSRGFQFQQPSSSKPATAASSCLQHSNLHRYPKLFYANWVLGCYTHITTLKRQYTGSVSNGKHAIRFFTCGSVHVSYGERIPAWRYCTSSHGCPALL